MQVHWDWLCLGVLLISSVTAEMHDEEIQDADVEVEDFDKNSQETDLDKGSSSLEVMYKTPKPTGEVYFTETFDDGVLTGVDHDKAMKVQERTIHLTLKVQSS